MRSSEVTDMSELKSYVVYETWLASFGMLPVEQAWKLRSAIDDYGLYRKVDLEKFNDEELKFLKPIFAQIDCNTARYENSKQNGATGGRPTSYNTAVIRPLLEDGYSGAEIGRFVGVKGNAITQNPEYRRWVDDGKPGKGKKVHTLTYDKDQDDVTPLEDQKSKSITDEVNKVFDVSDEKSKTKPDYVYDF